MKLIINSNYNNCGVYTNVHVCNSINFVGRCLATKVFLGKLLST